MAEIVVPAVHRVAIYANNFSAGGRNGGRDIGADARDVKPFFPETLHAPHCPSARHDAKTMPMSVTYHLTDLGKKLMPALNALYDWGEEHRASA